ncbi:MAG TPA: hypothetical protein VLJ84_02795, partial [Usitatibacter sp.]|nr:hypothetical protein [Usitatibacter sp.]
MSSTCLASSMIRHYHASMRTHLLGTIATLLSLVVFSAHGETTDWKSLNVSGLAHATSTEAVRKNQS